MDYEHIGSRAIPGAGDQGRNETRPKRLRAETTRGPKRPVTGVIAGLSWQKIIVSPIRAGDRGNK